MTDVDVGQIEERAKAATQGEWWTDGVKDYRDAFVFAGDGTSADFLVADGMTSEDASHIAGMSPGVALTLVARLRAAEEELAAVLFGQ